MVTGEAGFGLIEIPGRDRVARARTPVQLRAAVDQRLPDRRAETGALRFWRHRELIQVRHAVDPLEDDSHRAEGFAGEDAFHRQAVVIIPLQYPAETLLEQSGGFLSQFRAEFPVLDDFLAFANQRARAAVGEQFFRQAANRGYGHRGAVR